MHRFPRSSPPRAARRLVRSLLVVAALLALAALGAAGWPRLAAAATAPPPPTVSAKAFVVMDQDTGVVLAEKNPNERLPMASTTKIMTGLLVLEHFHNLATVIKAPRDAVGVGEDEIYLVKGEKLTVNQLLEALLIQSANDAAADLADAVAGTQAKFVALMNAKAVALGLTNTHYANPHGLTAPGHYTSALDLTHLARIAMRDPRFAGYVDHYTATIPWAHHSYQRVLVSHNELLEDYPWAYGVKTGWTDPAGYCIAAAGKWRGHRILVTLLGEPDDAQRLTDVVKLFHWSASQYAVRTVWPTGTTLAQATVPWRRRQARPGDDGAHHRLAAHRRAGLQPRRRPQPGGAAGDPGRGSGPGAGLRRRPQDRRRAPGGRLVVRAGRAAGQDHPPDPPRLALAHVAPLAGARP